MPEKREIKVFELMRFIEKYSLEDFSLVDLHGDSAVMFRKVIKQEDPYVAIKVIVDRDGDYEIIKIVDDPDKFDDVVVKIAKGNILEEMKEDDPRM